MITYNCTVCGKDTVAIFPQLEDFTEQGVRYFCTCEHCLNVLLVQTFPFEIEPSPFLEAQGNHKVCMN